MSEVAEHLDRFRAGDREGAFFGLIETGVAILPDLIAAFHGEQDARVREFLVEVIWQNREPSVIPFLGEALHDPEAAVWKQALDGLVALATPAALDTLRAAAERQSATPERTGEFREWLAEGIAQVESQIQRT